MQLLHKPYPVYVTEEQIYTEHAGEVIAWSSKCFSEKSFADEQQIFKYINGYWATLSQDEQAAIFGIYRQIAEIFDSRDFSETTDAQDLLSVKVAELMSHHSLERVRNYITIHSDVKWPQIDLPEVYVQGVYQNDKNHTREKTYIRSDYVDLVSMVVQLRAMVPIWGKYIARTGVIFGTEFKEYYAFALLQRSAFMAEAPIRKLYSYIKSMLPPAEPLTDLIRGTSTEEFPLHIMTVLAVRKLSLFDVRGNDPTPIMIRHISRHVTEKASRINTNTDKSVKPKRSSTNESGSDEDQMSFLELYKIREDISRGDVQYLRHCVKDALKIARVITPSVTELEVSTALTSMPALMKFTPEACQTRLLQWMIDPYIPAEAVYYFTASDRARCLCAVSAAYWARGHHVLAALCTAVPIYSDGEAIMSTLDSKGRFAAEVVTKLEEIYPHSKRVKSSKIIKDDVAAIDSLVRDFAAKSWQLTITDEQMLVVHPKYPKNRRLAIPHNFRELVAQLVIDIDSIN